MFRYYGAVSAYRRLKPFRHGNIRRAVYSGGNFAVTEAYRDALLAQFHSGARARDRRRGPAGYMRKPGGSARHRRYLHDKR